MPCRMLVANGILCQPQCWQNFEVDKRRELKMFGLDVLSDPNNEFGITAGEFINGLFAHWQRNRCNGDSFFPTIDEIISGSNSS